ncbi:ergothioneine biosynthesis protein EgtB [Blastopirellula marina]|uniref:Ergothioneine biosynthesis protein EgtB n=1 Tax=Blastopirellula marina TaxID=124 RepID=A0A2S8GBL7_9BACT|nr:ergothioneine biosynthesis protein EgtB [Blastopirellula marina]PQO41671.1 ergothioneine biosynthesis protein EgtB [Blastopirellula marina]PTL46114.1 ergothioneine biosynthesis protein EgtB [Blastopirellula marina]
MSSSPTQHRPPTAELLPRYEAVRQFTQTLCDPLEIEDYVIQSMPDASPVRWHLAHTTWFFETFVLKPFASAYQPANAAFEYLFNSYYNGIGEQFPRAKRGLLTRPTVAEVFEYRRHVDRDIETLLLEAAPDIAEEIASLVELGLHHEQQHQELMLTDLKHLLAQNPLYPAYHPSCDNAQPSRPAELTWHATSGGIYSIGHAGNGFAYDNESPRHDTLLHDFDLANRLTTNGEYLAFVEAGGYRRPELWLSLGWNAVQTEPWTAPLYWLKRDNAWFEFTLAGLQPLELAAPVTHISYFEADAFARWQGKRLPLEAEWEVASAALPLRGNFVESGQFHPAPAEDSEGLEQMLGDAWEWTASPYTPYPGYKPVEGAIGEYNGKFMCNQHVLRGGSCATSASHIRRTYRNFFPPEARWQFTGIRLAK